MQHTKRRPAMVHIWIAWALVTSAPLVVVIEAYLASPPGRGRAVSWRTLPLTVLRHGTFLFPPLPVQRRELLAMVDGYNTEKTMNNSDSVDLDDSLSERVDPIDGPLGPADFPWSQVQQWALRDHLPQYVIQVPFREATGPESIQNFVLWHTFSHEVTELSGYPLSFLMERHHELWRTNQTSFRPSRRLLPFLDEFEFSESGGLSGRVYGVPGVAEGTRIETTPVGNVHASVPQGYVRTHDGSVIYELGQPLLRSEAAPYYSLDGITTVDRKMPWLRPSINGKILLERTTSPNSPAVFDPDLIRLAGLTALVVGGAWATEILSHHLTINVFWV